jgi:ubiquinone/menaquinone biosynthesis C-methylase UbiE
MNTGVGSSGSTSGDATMHDERTQRTHWMMMRSESGPDLTSDFWMHRHFRAMSAIYQSLLHEAELLPGDRVLDLGCGSGTHFGWIAAQIGPEGSLVGYDDDPEHLRLAEERRRTATWAAQVELQQGSLHQLPFADASFDAVWCAGTLQYEADPIGAIREMVRVVRPGGKVAVQDVEMHTMLLGPMPDELLIALKDCLPRGATGVRAGRNAFVDWFVGHKLRGYLLQAGLREVRGDVRQRQYVHPLTEDERGFLNVAIPYLCSASPGVPSLPRERAEQLRNLSNPEAEAFLLNRPDFVFIEGRAIAVGVR